MPALSKDIGEKAAGFQALRGNTGAPSYSWQEDPDTGFILLPGAIGVVVDGVLVGSLPADLGGAPGGASGQVQFNDAGAFAGDTGMTFNSTTDVLTLAGGLVSPSVGPAAAQQHTLPAVASDTVALLAAAQTLTNKTIALGSNTVTGTTAQFNTALTDGDFATLAGAETLTNKVIGSGGTLNNMATGPHSMGVATNAGVGLRLSLEASAAFATLLGVGGTITVTGAGDAPSVMSFGAVLDGAVFAVGANNPATAAGIRAAGSGMSKTGAGTITNSAAIYIQDAAAIATNNYALWVDAGAVRLDVGTANGTVATVLGSLGPAGSNTTVQEWLTINIGGNVRYIPCF